MRLSSLMMSLSTELLDYNYSACYHSFDCISVKVKLGLKISVVNYIFFGYVYILSKVKYLIFVARLIILLY